MARPSQTPYFNYLNSAYLFLAPHDGNVDDCRLFMIVYDCLSLFMIVWTIGWRYSLSGRVLACQTFNKALRHSYRNYHKLYTFQDLDCDTERECIYRVSAEGESCDFVF